MWRNQELCVKDFDKQIGIHGHVVAALLEEMKDARGVLLRRTLRNGISMLQGVRDGSDKTPGSMENVIKAGKIEGPGEVCDFFRRKENDGYSLAFHVSSAFHSTYFVTFLRGTGAFTPPLLG